MCKVCFSMGRWTESGASHKFVDMVFWGSASSSSDPKVGLGQFVVATTEESTWPASEAHLQFHRGTLAGTQKWKNPYPIPGRWFMSTSPRARMGLCVDGHACRGSVFAPFRARARDGRPGSGLGPRGSADPSSGSGLLGGTIRAAVISLGARSALQLRFASAAC